MNVFGTWDVAVWLSSDDSSRATNFINNRVSQIPGVVDAFPVATFPHIGSAKETARETKEIVRETEEESEESA